MAVANFTIATTERAITLTNGNLRRLSVLNGIIFVAWRGLATLAEKYIRKGTQIYVEGKSKPARTKRMELSVTQLKLLQRQFNY